MSRRADVLAKELVTNLRGLVLQIVDEALKYRTAGMASEFRKQLHQEVGQNGVSDRRPAARPVRKSKNTEKNAAMRKLHFRYIGLMTGVTDASSREYFRQFRSRNGVKAAIGELLRVRAEKKAQQEVQ